MPIITSRIRTVPFKVMSARIARLIVILGYQHPAVTVLNASSPPLSRHRKMLTLQSTAFNHAEPERAVAKSAFLQGEGHARALDEIACAMKVLIGSAAEVATAVHGRVNTPRNWWLSVDRFLTSRTKGTRTAPSPCWQCALTKKSTLGQDIDKTQKFSS